MTKFSKHINSTAVFFSLLLLTTSAFCSTAIYQVTDAQGTFLKIPLTHDIYRYSQQINLQDLDVLDATQTPLPYRLVAVAPDIKKSESTITQEKLAFFPIPADATAETLQKLGNTQITIQGDNIRVETQSTNNVNANPEFYLIDLSSLNHDISGLRIDWETQVQSQYIDVELEATRNLRDWFSIAKSTLIKINQQEQSLTRNLINVHLAPKDYDYLRIKILRGADHLHITSVTAEQTISTTTFAPTPQENWSLVGSLAKNQATAYLPNPQSKTYAVTAWEFKRDEATPVDTVNIDIGSHAYGDSAKIFSRATESQNWQLQYLGIWFNAQIGNQWQKSNSVSLTHNRDKYWRVEFSESVKNQFIPVLEFGWQPLELQVIASNKPPYVLAINDSAMLNNNKEQVFKQIISNTKPVWVTAGLATLNIEPTDVQKNTKSVNWTIWLFWFALILAVAVLLLFSLKLFKQLNQLNPK